MKKKIEIQIVSNRNRDHFVNHKTKFHLSTGFKTKRSICLFGIVLFKGLTEKEIIIEIQLIFFAIFITITI